MLLTGGVHAKGIDEPRLMKLARDLAVAGTPVVTAEIDDLLHYRITPKLTDALEDAILWVAADRGLAADGRLGVFGVSFAGGLSIVAAGRPQAAPHVAYVVSFGGHGNLPDVVTFLCTGVQPDGTRRKPHDYGVIVTLMNTAEQVVPPEQVAPLREAITVIHARPASGDGRSEGGGRRLQADAGDDGRAGRAGADADALRQRSQRRGARADLLPHASAFTQDPALSPARSTTVTAPVFLLHGADDNVVPAIESRRLARCSSAPHRCTCW